MALNAVVFAVPRLGHGVVEHEQPLLVQVILPNAEGGMTSPCVRPLDHTYDA